MSQIRRTKGSTASPHGKPVPASSEGRGTSTDFIGGRRRALFRRVAAFSLLAILVFFWWATVYTLMVAVWWLLHGYFTLEEDQVPYVWNGVVDWTLMILALVSVWPVQRWLRVQIALFMEDGPEAPLQLFSQISQQMNGLQTPEEQMSGLVNLLARTLNMPYVSIETPDLPMPIAYGEEPNRQLIRLPLQYNHVALGSLQLAPRLVGGVAVHMDEQLLVDLARQISLTLYTMQLTVDLQESRMRIVTAREEARRQLRRDLHDGLGPSMAAMTMQADTARELMYDDPSAAERLLADLADQTQAMVTDIRRLVHGLRPPALDDVGLFGALELLVGSFGKPGLRTDIRLPESEPAMSAAMEVAIYRIVQEGLTNITKHARADYATVTLKTSSDGVVVSITDNGDGMPEFRQAGVGLHSMRERAEELGGTLTTRANKPTGTIVVASFPLAKGASNGTDSRTDL